MKKPNFFLVGAAKSGTTSLAYYLSQHPDVYLSPVKEPCYFLQDIGIDDFDEYLSLFRKAGRATAIGEASTGYLFNEASAQAILNSFPNSRIIIILRNPVSLAYSLWRYMSAHGTENLSFEEAISDLERERRRGRAFKESCAGWWCNYLYLERALYCNQVKMYLDTFPPQQVRIYIFEEFFDDVRQYCRDLFGFLGVDPGFKPQFRKLNEGGVPRSNFIRKLLTLKYPILRSLLPVTVRDRIRMFIKTMNITKGNSLPLAPETHFQLDSYFRDDITGLEKVMGRELTRWKNN
ncbi:MAG: sulfotransferase family protein [Desulfobacteraceae bacterium]